MSKAILVIDMPESCDKCPCFFSAYTDMCCQAINNRTINYPYPKDFRQDLCPLKPVPNSRMYSVYPCDEYGDGFADGYNTCLEEMLGQ